MCCSRSRASVARSHRPSTRGRGPHRASQSAAPARTSSHRDRRALLSESAIDDRAVGSGTRHAHAVGGGSDPPGANIGGDSDSVASIAGAILGAMYPTTVDHDWYRVVEVVNDHNLVAIANDLAQLRH